MPASRKSPHVGQDAPPNSAFTKLVTLIPEENKLVFSTAADLQTNIKDKIKECLESETGCYMLVTGVVEDMVEPIRGEMQEQGIRKESRLTYEPTMESLIIRLMPGAPHETVRWSFCFQIHNKVANIPGHSEHSLCPVGTTTFHFPGGTMKEGDGGFKPLDTRADGYPWPSLMVEVGYSESLPALRCDAQMWLENSGGRTRMVITIEIGKNLNELRLECWKMVVDPDGRVSRDAIPGTPGCNQYFDIDHAGTVSPVGHDLVIPYRTLFDTSQHGDPDIIISAGELSEWAEVIYCAFARS